MRLKRFCIAAGILMAALAALGILAGVLVYRVLPRYAADPLEILAEQTPAVVFTDPAGKVVHIRRTWEGQWRLEVPLEEIAPMAVRMILAVEDRNFYQHSGVDFTAVIRAMFQNLTSGRIVSGASTLSMQLASMSLGGSRRSWKRKFIQVLRCRKMEMNHSKEEILREYMNRIPMGGKLYGMESAAQFYFGRSAAELNISECALLCGLPQRPNAWRPDRHPEKALRRRDLVLRILERQKILSSHEVEKIRREENLRFRSLEWKADFMLLEKTPDRMYFDRVLKEAPAGKNRIRCAYRRELSYSIREILQRSCRSLPGVTSASAVLIENATGRVVVLIGSVEEAHLRGSQINGAFMRRSAGSALKPFLYAEAASGGMIVEESVLQDLPVRYGNYVPVNYDGKFRGEVLAGEALADSLNIPAIRLGAALGEERIRDLYWNLHVLLPEKGRRQNRRSGLSLILGSAGHTLFDLSCAYRVFAGDGVWSRCTFLAESTGENRKSDEIKRIFVPGTSAMISTILARRDLPGCTVKGISWKTGTSNGNKDAWCFAWTPAWTLGVWFGNKDNREESSLVGVEAAAPAAGKIFSLLQGSGEGIRWAESYTETELCRESGLRASPGCRERFRSRMLRHAPLRLCPRQEKESSVVIRTPVPGKYFLPESEQKISLTVESTMPPDSAEAPYWILNGKLLGRFRQKRILLERGSYSLRLIMEDPRYPCRRVDFTVE